MPIARRRSVGLQSIALALVFVRAIAGGDQNLTRTARAYVFSLIQRAAKFAGEGAKSPGITEDIVCVAWLQADKDSAEVISLGWALADEEALLEQLRQMKDVDDFSADLAARVIAAIERFELA